MLAVVAHPDDEAFGLGALLDAFAGSGSTVSVLCLTHGEASTIHGRHGGPRDTPCRRAAGRGGGTRRDLALLRDYPDGALASVASRTLADEVIQGVRAAGAAGLVVFDPSGVTGHSDHATAKAAALEAAAALELPVLGWTLPRQVADRLNEEFDTTLTRHEAAEVDLVLSVDRKRQRMASLSHASQAAPSSVLWRRLELLQDLEHLRGLRPESESRGVQKCRRGVE